MTQPRPSLGPLGELGPADVLAAIRTVRDGLVVDLSIPLDPAVLPPADPRFTTPLERRDVVTPSAFSALAGSGSRGFHLDAFGGGLHQGTHLDAFAHLVVDGRIFGERPEADLRTERGWTEGGVETVPPIVARGLLLDFAADGPLEGATEIGAADVTAALERSPARMRPGDAILVRTGKMRELAANRAGFRDRGPGIGLEAARLLADRGMAVFGSDTADTEPVPIVDWERTVHAELLVRRGVHLLEWLDLDPLAAALDARGRADFLLVALALPIRGATGSWLRPIAIL
ncbi:MAG TPA: cyclase family protein [Candidatus Limnocylindrales bacterium]|nr:cyclase family protein [Candidatus Limnocylindrales bacterium]